VNQNSVRIIALLLVAGLVLGTAATLLVQAL
jgi:hypothetical protein